MFDPFDILRPDPKQNRRILDSVEPSDYFPKAGEFFRVRSALIASRSYMGDIWECIESQGGAVMGRKVLDTYSGLTAKSIGDVLAFVAGDVIFYDCSQMWTALGKSAATTGEQK